MKQKLKIYIDELVREYSDIENEELIAACFEYQLRVQGQYGKTQNVPYSAFSACIIHYDRKRGDKDR